MKIEIYIRMQEKAPSFYREAIDEYLKRLGPYCKVKCTYVKKNKMWDSLIIPADGYRDYYVEEGKNTFSSEEWSRQITEWEDSGIRTVRLFAGAGDPGTKDRLSVNLSMLSMHPAMQGMILVEQIYRGYRIKNHQPYHK